MRRFVFVLIIVMFPVAAFHADGPFDFDREYRQEFKGIVIHHTGTSSDNPGIKFLSDIQKVTVYKPVFDSMPGQKIYSNHFYENKETFFCYHWLVYPDGRKIKVLKDIYKGRDNKWYIDYMGWHAGSWEVNGKTIAIAVAGNYMNRRPSEAALKAMAEIIAGYKHTTGIDLEIIGHREVKATECPGNKFLGANGWKKTLIKMAEEWKTETSFDESTDAE